METRASRAACSKRLHTCPSSADVLPLLSLPRELVELVLARVDPSDLPALLGCSKAMAQQVVQRSSGKTALRVPVWPGKSWAATQHLLQWSAPACVVLYKLERMRRFADNETEQAVLSLMGTTQQQFMFLTELCLKGLELPWVVPPGVADTCPNLLVLELDNCTVTGNSTSTSTSNACSTDSSNISNCTMMTSNDSDDSSSEAGGIDSRHVAPSIRHLRLRNTVLAHPHGTILPYVFAEQLRDSLPSLTCLEVEQQGWWLNEVLPQLLRLWPTQLTQVYACCTNGPATLTDLRVCAAQVSLKKLIMPYHIVTDVDLPTLLQLQHLTHLELNTFSRTNDDLSNHSCSWEYLHLHLVDADLEVNSLLNVPLHSLTVPLLLGHPSAHSGPQIRFPYQASAYRLSRLQRLANQLVKCGVQMLPSEVRYQAERELPEDLLGPISSRGAVLPIISAAFGPAQQVRLDSCILNHQAIQVLGLAHQHRLQQLALFQCSTGYYAQPWWECLLTCLPGLGRVLFSDIWPYGWQEHLDDIMPQMIVAMAQQPLGRRIEVHFPECGVLVGHNQDVAVRDWTNMLMQTDMLIEAGVEITTRVTMSGVIVVTATQMA